MKLHVAGVQQRVQVDMCTHPRLDQPGHSHILILLSLMRTLGVAANGPMLFQVVN